MRSGLMAGPSWADWQELPRWGVEQAGPAFERQLREVPILCGDEGARQMRRALSLGDTPALRSALRMIDQSAGALGAALLKDLCGRLLAMPDARLTAVIGDCADLIDELIPVLHREPPQLDH